MNQPMPYREEESFPNDPRDLRQLCFKSGAAEYIHQVLSLDREFVKNPPATYFWRVRGDEYRILGLKNRDLLIVDCSVKPAHGSLAICVIDGYYRIRRLQRWRGEFLPLRLRNPSLTDPFDADGPR
jgi:DNA polymerase V